MRFRTLTLACSLIAVHTAASAWFFFFIPLPRSQSSLLSNEICVGESVKVGDRTTGPSGATIEIQSIVGHVAWCQNAPNAPVLAKFITVPNAQPAPAKAAPATSKLGYAHEGDPLQDKRSSLAAPPSSVSDNAPGQSEVARKLRELSGLLRDGVITQTEFDEKKKELLRNF